MDFLAGRRRLVFVITFLLVWLVGASSVAADAAELMKATVLIARASDWPVSGVLSRIQFLKPASWRDCGRQSRGQCPYQEIGPVMLCQGEALTAQGFGTLLVQVVSPLTRLLACR